MRGSQEGQGVRAERRAGWCLRAQAGPVLGAASRANAQGCKCFPEPLKCDCSSCLWTSPLGWYLGKHTGQTGTLAGAALEEAGAAPWERTWENWDAGGSRVEPARSWASFIPRGPHRTCSIQSSWVRRNNLPAAEPSLRELCKQHKMRLPN